MKVLFSLTLAMFATIGLTGCGGGNEEGDTSHLEGAEGQDEAAAAAAAYESYGKDGPPADAGDATSSDAGSSDAGQ